MATIQIANGHASSSTMSPEPREIHSTSSSISGGYSAANGNENGCNPTLYQVHNEEVVNHLYNSGFQTGNYADTILHVHQHTYGLHAIILSRSPLLAHLMSTSPQTGGQRTIYVPLDHEHEVTQEGFAIALGYLYSAVSLNLIRPDNARGVLAAACLLGGMDDLCRVAYEACRQSITVSTIDEWLDFIDNVPLHSSSNGTATPDRSVQTPTSVYGFYAQRLRDDVFEFLVVTLPVLLNVYQAPSVNGAVSPSVESAPSSGRETLLQIFSRVPFDLFKAAIESATFQIGSDQARFRFAKDAIDVRKKAGMARATGAEETVVLAFGGGNGSFGGSAVHVTRKMRKRPLWKVNS